MDAGDHIQGTSYGTYDNGHTIVNLMNAAGYTAATLGNHEFDYNMTGTKNVIEWADFDYISCNIIDINGSPLLPAYQVYTAANGKKVAFLGMTTPESITKSTPAYFMNDDGEIVWSFSEGDEGAKLYQVIQDAIDAAATEADYVIGVGHMGVDEGSAPYTSEDVIQNTSGFTAFIDGHSHTQMEMKKVTDKAGKEIVLTQTKCYLEYVGEMTIDADGNVTAQLHDAEDLADVTPDSKVKAIEDEIISEMAAENERVIAHTDVRLDTHNGDERLVRKQETAIGNFCADATYYYFDSRGYDIDIAFMNGGGIRAPLDGDITIKNLKDIYPWGNVLCLVKLTGQQILDGLEFGSRKIKSDGTSESGGFLHVSGMKYKIDPTVEDTTQSDENGIWTGGPTGDYRVYDVQVKNRETGDYEPLDLEQDYTIGGINYTLRNLGDGFAMFTGENLVDGVAVDYMALEEYARSFPEDSENNNLPTLKAGMGYDGPEGRIVIEAQSNEPTEITTDGDLSKTFAEIPTDDAEVKVILSGDINLTETARVTDGQNITLDMAGYDIIISESVGIKVDGGILTITDSGEGGEIAFADDINNAEALIEQEGGEINLENAVLRAESLCVRVTGSEEETDYDKIPRFMMNGGSVISGETGVYAENAIVNISGGRVEASDPSTSSTAAYYTSVGTLNKSVFIGSGAEIYAESATEARGLCLDGGGGYIAGDAEITAVSDQDAVGVQVENGSLMVFESEEKEPRITAESESGTADAVRVNADGAADLNRRRRLYR